MADTTSDVLIETIMDWGVDTIFGLPGDGINGIMEALRTRQDKIRFVQVRHEESAAFMACAYAKYTGKLGVCLATSGPGGIHLLNGLYDAKLDGQPVLAITGMHYHDLIGTLRAAGRRARQALHGRGGLQRSASWARRTSRTLADLACRTALGYRGVAHITFPVDLQEQEVERERVQAQPAASHVRRLGARARACRTSDDLRRAAEVLNAGKKVAILAGQGALARHATSWSRSPKCSARRSSRRCSARRRCPTTARTPPAASACWAPSPRRRRWRSATRC